MLELKNISKIYQTGSQPVTALDGVELKFEDRGFVFILGRSGSGKSTLLHIIGGLDSPTDGEIVLDGKSGKDFRERDWNNYRKNAIGFVFQEYNLLSEFNVYDNLAIAAEMKKIAFGKPEADKVLELVGLEGMGKRKISQLSGGQRQRVAIARALAKQPKIILADEPTGALDQTTGNEIMTLLKQLSQSVLVIVVTHDREFAETYGDRVIEIADGKITADTVK